MNNIKGIIATHRSRIEAAGLLARTGGVQLSQRTAAMRPSLTKVQSAFRERPVHPVAVQPSPISLLFEFTLPRIEHVLLELGEERAEQIVRALCEHGKTMIRQHGVDGAREHLGELFKDLSNYEAKIKEANGVEDIIEAYRLVDFEGKGENYLTLALKDKIELQAVDELGGISSLLMGSITTDSDLIHLKKVKSLESLHLKRAQVTDAGLVHLRELTNLKWLDLAHTQVSDVGLAHLRGLINLSVLQLMGTQVTDAGVERLMTAIPGLRIIK